MSRLSGASRQDIYRILSHSTGTLTWPDNHKVFSPMQKMCNRNSTMSASLTFVTTDREVSRLVSQLLR